MQRRLRILHLEDNIYDAELIKSTLESLKFKFTIKHVKTKEEYIKYLDEEEYDLIFCDYKIPSFNGIEALKIARNKLSEIPVIFISGTIGEERAVELLKSGATDYILKDNTTRLPIAIERALHEVEERNNLREAREALRKSEEQYRNIFENAAVGIYKTTIDGKILAGNPAFIKMLGYSSFADISQLHAEEIYVNKDDRVRFIDLLFSVGGVRNFESVWKRKDGSKIYGLENAVAIKDSLGNLLYFEGTALDTTEKKAAQQFLEKSEKLLAESQEIALLGSWEINAAENKITWSKGFYLLLGYQPFEVEPSLELFLRHIHPDDREYMEKEINELDQRSGIYYSEYRVIKKDGSIRYHSGKGNVAFDDKGKLLRVYGIDQDVTGIKETEIQLIKAKEKAEESDRLKTAFLNQISHEIRTPLNSILNISDIFKDEIKNNNDQDLLILFEGMDSAGKRLIRTIDMILNMSTLQIGAYQLNITEFNLTKVVHRVMNEFKSLATSRNLYLEFHSNLGSSNIKSDEYLTSHIVQNLLDNAIKYTLKGGVKITTFDMNDRLCVKIVDSGIGISKDFYSELFKPFSQESIGYSRKYEGNGLGLALVKKYADLINAEITFESEKEVGTTFTVSFNPILKN